jgi:hypothetical protein
MFKYIATAAAAAFGALTLVSVDPGKSLTYYFKDLEQRGARGEETPLEVAGLQVAYGGMVAVGSVLYPEAAEVLYEFCWGDGDEPEIESDYVRQSPFIRKKLAGLKPGQRWSGWYKQTEDVRLSYAFNPITIEKRRGGEIVVTSPIKVAPLGSGIYTRLYMGPLTFDLPDSLMRVACDEHEYTSVVRWKE